MSGSAKARRLRIFALWIACLMGLDWGAWGEGFRNPPAGAFSLGRAGGRLAHIDDASAVAHNPANLMDLERMELQLTPTLVYITADYESPAGMKASTEDPWKLLPNFFAAMPLKESKITLGLGVTVPFGLSHEWEETGAFGPLGPLRYTAPHFAELKTINANPTLAFPLGDKVTVGIGLDVMWSQLKLEQYYPWFALPFLTGLEPEGAAKADGDGVGVGANFGLTWKVAPKHRLAFAYRSPVQVDYEGDFRISNMPATVGFLGGTPESSFESRIEFPTIVSVGYGYELSDRARLGVDFEWIEFSTFQSLPLDFENNGFFLPASIPQEWNDTFTVGVGGDWQFARDWVARASYQFYESPVPNETFSPTIPDANQQVFTVGLGFRRNRHSMEVAYGGIFYEDRDIQEAVTPSFNGRYEILVHLFSFAYRYSF